MSITTLFFFFCLYAISRFWNTANVRMIRTTLVMSKLKALNVKFVPLRIGDWNKLSSELPTLPANIPPPK